MKEIKTFIKEMIFTKENPLLFATIISLIILATSAGTLIAMIIKYS